jgi:hypothetical protein
VKAVDLIVEGEASGCDHHTDGRGFAKCNIEKGLETLEGLISSLGGGVNGAFAAGTGVPTVADMLLVPQLYNAGRFNIDLARCAFCLLLLPAVL